MRASMIAPPDKQQIQAGLEATRLAYHELLASLSPDHWARKSANPELTVKELMWHMAWSMGWMARSIDGVKRGKGLHLPSFLVDPGRKFAMRWLARRATPETAAQRYNEGHAALLGRLDETLDHEWRLGATRFGELRTVEWCFGQPIAHFEEHAPDVRRAIDTHA